MKCTIGRIYFVPSVMHQLCHSLCSEVISAEKRKSEAQSKKSFSLNERSAAKLGKRDEDRFFCKYEKNFPKTATRYVR